MGLRFEGSSLSNPLSAASRFQDLALFERVSFLYSRSSKVPRYRSRDKTSAAPVLSFVSVAILAAPETGCDRIDIDSVLFQSTAKEERCLQVRGPPSSYVARCFVNSAPFVPDST